MEGKLITDGNNNYSLLDYNNELVASTMESGLSNGKLSLKNCQAIERGYDLDELAEKEYPLCRFENQNGEMEDLNEEYRYAFTEGFQKALQLLGDKKFSEEQILSLFKPFSMNLPFHYEFMVKNAIQSLQQNEWDVQIEMVFKHIPKNNGIHNAHTIESVPKLDNDGCLILKRKV